MSSATPIKHDFYRASYKVDLPHDSLVYTAFGTMAPNSPAPYIVAWREWNSNIFSSDCVVCGSVRAKRFILLGALTVYRSTTMFSVRRRDARIATIEVEQPGIREGEAPEEIIILEGEDWRELLCCYADAVAEKMGVKPINAEKNITGYCTWYYYYKDVTQAQLLENVEALAANRERYAAQYVQIDDGYQTLQGDWLEQHPNWPVSLADTAKKITDAGMIPGIWTMPFVASTASRVYNAHPDWFVKDENGESIIRPGWSPEPDHQWACLDTTNPEVLDHLQHVFRTFWEMGYRYFKMDGLNWGLLSGKRFDPQATAVSSFRTCLKAIREAVPEAFLLACSSPVMPCIGLVDSFRVGNDTSRYYSTDRLNLNFPRIGVDIRTALHASLSHFWIFDRWFRADPDVMMARQDNAFYTRGEAKHSILSGIMTGISITSDHLGTIAPDRLELLAKAQDLRMRDVRPMEPEHAQWPEVFEGTIEGKRAVAIFNERPAEKKYILADIGLENECIDLLDNKLYSGGEIDLPSHDAVLLMNRKDAVL